MSQANNHHHNKLTQNAQIQNQPLKRLTRLLKTKINKSIELGNYQTALQELNLISGQHHWALCKQAQLLQKMGKIVESQAITRAFLEKEQSCSQCLQLFNSLSQKIQMQKRKPPQTKKNTTSPPQKQFEQFLSHLKANNCEFKNIEIQELSPGFRTVLAKEDIQKDQIVIYVPSSLMITVELAKKSPIGHQIQPIMHQLRSPKHSLLSLFLLCEEQKGNSSQFYHYLKMLPRNLENFPIFYSESLLKELKNTYFSHILERKKQDLEEDFARLKTKSQFARKISYEDFLRARMVVSSRIFGITMNEHKTDALVPLADMLNHSIPKMTTWSYEDEKNAFVVRNNDNRIEKGQQIYDSYGCKCNSRFLLNYGFIQQKNPSNEVGIKLRDRQNRAIYRMIRLTKDLSSPEFDSLLGYSRMMVGGYVTSNRKQAEYEEEISPEFTSREMQIQMWKFIESEISEQISMYPTSMKTDQKILKQKEMSDNYRKCVEIRLGEKDILHYYLDMARSMIMLFEKKSNNTFSPEYKTYLRKIPYQRIIRNSE